MRRSARCRGSSPRRNDIDEDVKMVQENGKWLICS